MITKQQIAEIATSSALSVVFCNAGEEGWPDDPMKFLEQCLYEDMEDSGKEMIPYEPFEHYDVGMLIEEVESFHNAFFYAINAALTIERG